MRSLNHAAARQCKLERKEVRQKGEASADHAQPGRRGRRAAAPAQLDDLEVENLVPNDLAGGAVDEFLDRLPRIDAAMAERVAAAARDKKVLRYVAEVDFKAGTARVRLGEFGIDHPFANISLTDNIVQFATRRYCDNPLIVRGPGAGPDVTAAGIFADLLRLCSMLSGSSE